MLPSCMCITINTAAKTIKTSVSCIISGCNFILIALWLRKNALDVKSEDAFPHSAALSASRHHLITHDLTVHLLSPPPPPSLPPSLSQWEGNNYPHWIQKTSDSRLWLKGKKRTTWEQQRPQPPPTGRVINLKKKKKAQSEKSWIQTVTSYMCTDPFFITSVRTRRTCVVCVVCVSESARQVAAVYKVLHGESDYCEIDTRVRKIKNEKENLAVFTFPRKTHTLFFLHLCVERLTCIKTKLQHTHIDTHGWALSDGHRPRASGHAGWFFISPSLRAVLSVSPLQSLTLLPCCSEHHHHHHHSHSHLNVFI